VTATIGHYTPVRLRTAEFEVCWDILGLGELPHVLDLPSPGRSFEERGRIVDEVRSGLSARGLADGQGLHPDVAGLLTLLHRFSWAVDAWLLFDRSIRALGAHGGNAAVVAMIDDQEQEVLVYSVPADAVLTEVVGQLPEIPAAGRWPESVRVEATALDAALAAVGGTDPVALADELVRQGERPETATAVARLAEGTGPHGQFGVTVTDGFGRRHRGAGVVGFHDTTTARIMHLRRGGWVTLTPAGHDHLAWALRELLDETREAR